MVREHLDLDPFAGHLFVFTSRRRDQTRFCIPIGLRGCRVPLASPVWQETAPVSTNSAWGAAVIHVEVSGTASRELPAWMVDGSICRGMELGPPEVSIAALNELWLTIDVSRKAANQTPALVSSLVKERESRETAAKNISPAVQATGIRNSDSSRREGTN